jgi:EAL domain-containing protein (putative c-di-GMP-specific phosphodiesterase class I)
VVKYQTMSIKTDLLEFKQGDIIFMAGDSAHCAYIVESGHVGLYTEGKENNLIATLDKGELLGEMGIINDAVRSISAYADSDVVLLVIDREQITNRLENSDPIIRGVMEVLLRRIRNMLNEDYYESVVVETENLIVTKGMHKIRFEKELFRALDKDELINVYQPMVNLKEGYIAGFEALSRWLHPEKGMVSPFEFISLAEESDFIVPMGINIFNNACKQLAEFQKIRNLSDPNLPDLFMSINVSASQLTADNFLKKIKAITKEHGVKPRNIKIEITESQVVDYQSIQVWIDECNAFGFQLSLDDFGTGYSGFQHLLELDFHTIKIDQAFIKTIETNKKSIIMLEVITDMAKRLNMSVVAEGIEDLKSAKLLTEIGVDYGQGYYFYKPMLAEEVIKKLS